MSIRLEADLTIERLSPTNSPAIFWPVSRTPDGWQIMGFNLSPWVVRLWFRAKRV